MRHFSEAIFQALTISLKVFIVVDAVKFAVKQHAFAASGHVVIGQIHLKVALDGTVFDESKGKPAEFRVDGVIKGWTEILQLMKAGSKVKVVIPQDLAYGARYAGEKIPPFSTLVFEIELVKVLPAAAADSTSADEL